MASIPPFLFLKLHNFQLLLEMLSFVDCIFTFHYLLLQLFYVVGTSFQLLLQGEELSLNLRDFDFPFLHLNIHLCYDLVEDVILFFHLQIFHLIRLHH